MKSETLLAAFAILVAVAAMVYTAYVAKEDRNAALVGIGIAVLRADPQKEGHVRAAREWALDLIDANAGGVRFSAAARAELLENPLAYGTGWFDTGESYTPDKPPPNSK